MYADYAFYKSPFGGSLILESDFPALERQAELHIDFITFNRLHQGYDVTDNVKMAVCAVAETIKKHEAAAQTAETTAALKSENVDGYNVSYSDYETTKASINFAKTSAAMPYLISTGLMDRSVCI